MLRFLERFFSLMSVTAVLVSNSNVTGRPSTVNVTFIVGEPLNHTVRRDALSSSATWCTLGRLFLKQTLLE